MPQQCEERDALHRLSQAHLVGQHPIHSNSAQQGHPVHADQLVPFFDKEDTYQKDEPRGSNWHVRIRSSITILTRW